MRLSWRLESGSTGRMDLIQASSCLYMPLMFRSDEQNNQTFFLSFVVAEKAACQVLKYKELCQFE